MAKKQFDDESPQPLPFKKGVKVSVIDADEVGVVHDVNTHLTTLQTQFWVKFVDEKGNASYRPYAADELEAVEASPSA